MQKIVRYSELPMLLLATPVFLCVSFKLLPLGSIGPLVFFYGIFQLLISPMLVFRLIIQIFSKSNTVNNTCKTDLGYPKHIFIAIVIVSIALGMIAGIIGWNLFIELTRVFGLMDYQLL